MEGEAAFAQYGEDLNGDGIVLVKLNQHVSDTEDVENASTYALAAQMQFLSDMNAEESYFLLLDDPAHFVAHDYARDTVKAYFETVAPDVRDQWPLYEKLCRSHVTMQGILNKSFVPTV